MESSNKMQVTNIDPDIKTKESYIEEYISGINDFSYVEIKDKRNVENIYNLYKYGILKEFDFGTGEAYNYYGLYYYIAYNLLKTYTQTKTDAINHSNSLSNKKSTAEIFKQSNVLKLLEILKLNGFSHIQFNTNHSQLTTTVMTSFRDKSLKYYSMAWIQHSNGHACLNLGDYFYSEGYHDTGILYYEKACEKNISSAMTVLGMHYCDTKKYDLMKKYWTDAINLGNVNAIMNMAGYYLNIDKNDYLTEKYLLLAVEKQSLQAMICLGLFYRKNKNDTESAIKYIYMAMEQNHEFASPFMEEILNDDETKTNSTTSSNNGNNSSNNNNNNSSNNNNSNNNKNNDTNYINDGKQNIW